MKKILITGQNSYIGNKFEEWVSQWQDDYKITKISVRNDDWKNQNWNVYDVVLNVAGIAHNSSDASLEELYYQVNRDLTIELAGKAKIDEVNQFIHLSSMIVYGASKTENGMIEKDTKPEPANFYGDSKLQGELGIMPLANDNFKIAIIRPPMIYGKGSKGNYPLLSKLAQKTPIFPDFKNKRSMLHIDNLNEFIRLLIDNENSGIYHPQNEKYVETSNLVREVAQVHNHKIFFTKIGNGVILVLKNKIKIVDKVFGNQLYDKSLSTYANMNYQIRDFHESIKYTEL
ncbi:NAD-dependent epimerase/dehydratase family protein [Aerococcus agrisoli]|uniref:NAD-dependent epimerase/dehydratase family protein n=1 Tax=Aerococcus agrisoli TaxID=2487350 RepID=A0A3N4H689_9LACT|nr:NAD-dependent epimerase/dehydratase family protein [Aerococcus agrisoli]RPA60684.1 NAD-dependent epimerase/dehydratase family protein [Aerococcus agrisoli]